MTKRGRKTKRKYVRRYKPKKKPSVFSKIFSSIIAIVSISALILFIAVVIGEISDIDRSSFSGVTSKFFTSFNVDKVLEGEVPTDEKISSDYSFSLFDKKKLLFKICLISDIHQDKNNLFKALEKVKSSGCRNIFVIGDLTNYGDVPTLKEVRNILNEAGVDYYAIPGDHDLAQSVSVENFNSVFGINYHLMEYSEVGFLIIDNSPNFTPISKIQMSWIESNIEKVDFVVLSQPLFTEGLNSPFNGIFMGSMMNVPESDEMKKKQVAVKDQGEYLLDLIRKSENVKAIFAGEHHRSSKLGDSVRSDLTHYVIGAVTSTVNELPQSAIQTPRFSVLSIYENGDYFIEDILID